MTTMPQSGRDHRVDFFRGLALTTIFINHIPGNFFENFTSRNFGFSDSAELFVFLAGYAAALAYFSVVARKGVFYAWAKAWRRAFELYAAHLLAVAVGAALLAGAAVYLADDRFLEWISLTELFTRTPEALVGIATLGFQPGYLNILPMYIVLLLLLPLLLVLRARLGLGSLLAFSVGLYVAAQLLRLNLPQWPTEGGWFFNPLTWQLIFAIGLAAGWAVREGRVLVAFHPWLYAAAAAYVGLALVLTVTHYQTHPVGLPLPVFLHGFDKTFATLPRVLHLLALVYLVAYAPRRWFSRLSARGAFTTMGRHALPVFVAGSLLAILGQVLRDVLPMPTMGRQIALDLGLVSVGVVAQIALAKGLQWYRDTGAPAARTAPEKATAPLALASSARASAQA